MSSLYNEKTLEKIKGIRATSLKTFVTILILEIIVWAIIIVTKQSSTLVGRFQATFLIVACALFVSIINFRNIEKGEQGAQLMSIISLAACAIWTILQVLVVWGVIKMFDGDGLFSISITEFGKLISVVSSTMLCMMLAGCVASINENGGSIKPLKITAFISIICVWIIGMILTFKDYSSIKIDNLSTLSSLLGLAFLSFVVTGIAAAVISKTNRKDRLDRKMSSETIKEDVNTQAAIQKMVEKEVQARLKAEKEKAEREAMPPLQDGNMAPTVSHDNEIKVDAPNDLNNR